MNLPYPTRIHSHAGLSIYETVAASKPIAMAARVTAGLRLLRSYTHRLSLAHSTRAAPVQFSGLRTECSELRFLSTSVPRKTVSSAKVKRREAEEGGESGNNGSVMAYMENVGNGGAVGEGGGGRIVVSELHKEATEAYLAYAMSVLLGRALPDIRDGLKPVHRRILYVILYKQ